MDYLNYIKRVNWKMFGKVFLTREEIYNETAGETQAIQVFVKPDYYNSEFNINGEDKGHNQKS